MSLSEAKRRMALAEHIWEGYKAGYEKRNADVILDFRETARIALAVAKWEEYLNDTKHPEDQAGRYVVLKCLKGLGPGEGAGPHPVAPPTQDEG